MRRPASRACVSRARMRIHPPTFHCISEVCVSPPSPYPGHREIRHCIPVTRLPSPSPGPAPRLFPRELARPPRLNTCQHVGWHRFFAEIENPKNKTSEARLERESRSTPLRRMRKRMREQSTERWACWKQWGRRHGRQETASLFRNQFILLADEGSSSPVLQRARCSRRI